MKLVLSILVGTLVIGGLAIFFGDRLISSRHTVGKFTYPIPATDQPVAANVVWSGVQTALQNCGMDSQPWTVSPSSRWQASDNLPRTNQGSVLIILSNRIDRTELYGRVAFISTNALEYHIYRPK